MNRPLSPGERLLWLIDQAVPQNFVMSARLSYGYRELTDLPLLLRHALDIIGQRYPSLNCRIKTGKAPGFVTGNVPGIPLRIIQRKGDDHWIEESEKEMLEPLPWTQGPMVRAVLMESPHRRDLLLTFCHLTTDATSGVKFLKHLLTIADRLSRGEALTREPPLPGLPPVDDLLKEEVKQRALALAHKENGAEQFPDAVELQGDREVPVEQRKTRIIHRQLTKTGLKKLMVKSRKEKATLHTAFCAALLQTTLEQIRLSRSVPVPQKGPLLMGCISAVNIRHLFKQPPGDNLGNFISNALHYQLIDDAASLWEAARETQKSLQEHLEAGKDISLRLGAANLLNPGDTPIRLITRLKDLFPPTGITNMGQLDIPGQFGNFLLENLQYNPSINPSLKNGFGLSVSAFGDHTALNFLYAAPYISEQRAHQMVESAMRRLKKA